MLNTGMTQREILNLDNYVKPWARNIYFEKVKKKNVYDSQRKINTMQTIINAPYWPENFMATLSSLYLNNYLSIESQT